MATEHLSVRIDDELADLIEQEQKAVKANHGYEVQKSEIIRTALREHLSGNVRVAVGAEATVN